MLPYLILLFVSMPLIELWLLLRLAEAIELGPTILVVIMTGVVGASLARRQGLRTYMRVQSDLAAGRMPASEIVDGLLILVAGVVLITPGLMTDVFGFCLLVPPIRAVLKRKVAAYFRSRMVVIHQTEHDVNQGFVDVEATEVTESSPPSEEAR